MSDHGGVFAVVWIMSGIWPYGNLAAWMNHDIFVQFPAVGLLMMSGMVSLSRWRRWGWQLPQDAITVISIMTVVPSRK